MQGKLKGFENAVGLLVNRNVLTVKLRSLQNFTYIEAVK